MALLSLSHIEDPVRRTGKNGVITSKLTSRRQWPAMTLRHEHRLDNECRLLSATRLNKRFESLYEFSRWAGWRCSIDNIVAVRSAL